MNKIKILTESIRANYKPDELKPGTWKVLDLIDKATEGTCIECAGCGRYIPDPEADDTCKLETIDIKVQGHVEDLKTKRNRLIDEAAKVAQEYAQSCDIGPERNRAFDCYESVLYSTMER